MAFMHSMCKQANSDSGTVYIQQPFSLEIMPWEGLTLECETIEELFLLQQVLLALKPLTKLYLITSGHSTTFYGIIITDVQSQSNSHVSQPPHDPP